MSNDPRMPPPKPWITGEQNGYKTLKVTVTMVEGPTGLIWSGHDFSTEEDRQLAGGLRGQGDRQLAFALLTEALRREAYLSALVKLTRDRGLVSRWDGVPDDQKRDIEAELARQASSVIEGTLSKLAPGVAREILEMLAGEMH